MLLKKLHILSNLKTISNCRLVCTSLRVGKDESNEGDGRERGGASKLKSLLLSIINEEKSGSTDTTPKIDVPRARVKQRFKKAKEPVIQNKSLGSRIVDAASTVASQMDGDQKEIEARLLHKLLYKDTRVKEEILKATSGNENLKDLLSSMEIEQEEKKPVKVAKQEFSRAAQIRSVMGKRRISDKTVPRRDQRINLFGEKPLGIFDAEITASESQLKTWSDCEARERKLSVTHPPANYFEQLIDWTEKGIVWKFPIDNEQGLDRERTVSFASHVLLESHLEGWCPPAGPIRHFMELVCVGLSRNHWLSSTEKEQHIMWYKDFFSEKSQLIKELGAGDIP